MLLVRRPQYRPMDNPVSGLRAALESDAQFRTEFLSASSFDDAAALAARHGWIVAAVDAETLTREYGRTENRELSDTELDRVSGGATLNQRSVNPLVISRDRT